MQKADNFVKKYWLTCGLIVPQLILVFLSKLFDHSPRGLVVLTAWGIVTLVAALVADNYAERAEATAQVTKRRIWAIIIIMLSMYALLGVSEWFLLHA
ncbi:hypothetical protein EQ500_10060 [Lactobacillus sp. XV13L]|nr:hypothetical protein [Lactobacillus sp. XV13L]